MFENLDLIDDYRFQFNHFKFLVSTYFPSLKKALKKILIYENAIQIFSTYPYKNKFTLSYFLF